MDNENNEMAVAARSSHLRPDMEQEEDLYEEFGALGIRCWSTSLSAPEMNCPSMTFSSSSSTATEAENETPPSSPMSESSLSTPMLKFAFEEYKDDEDFSTQDARRKSAMTHASRNGYKRLALEAETEGWDGYEAESEGTKVQDRAIGSPRFGAKKTKDRARKITTQQPGTTNVDDPMPCASSASNGVLPAPRKSMRYRARKPSGLSIRVPQAFEDDDWDDNDTMVTPVANRHGNVSKREPARTKDASYAELCSPLLVSGQPSCPSPSDSQNVTAGYYVPLAALQPLRPVLRPYICEEEPSPIEALPSPLLLQEGYAHDGYEPLIRLPASAQADGL